MAKPSPFSSIISSHRTTTAAENSEAASSVNPPAKKIAKSVDPDYIKLTCYIEQSVHRDMKRLLLDQPNGEISDLVNQLLKDWIARERGRTATA